MKNKKYFVKKFNKKWDKCYKEAEVDVEENGGDSDIVSEVATEIFDDTANAEEIVGYYIVYHGESAFEDWTANIKGLRLTEQDKEIDRILKRLYSKKHIQL